MFHIFSTVFRLFEILIMIEGVWENILANSHWLQRERLWLRAIARVFTARELPVILTS
jgi:hypothetical protein